MDERSNNQNGNGLRERSMEEGTLDSSHQLSYGNSSTNACFSIFSLPFLQKIIAEILGTFVLIFAGCAAVAVNLKTGAITFPGICIVWGLACMIVVYSVGHISGAHVNPAVTIAFASCRRFPWKQVPAYIVAQVIGATLASATLHLLFDIHQHYFGTVPVGSNVEAFAMEFIVSFNLMFVISGVATDNRAIGELAGLAVGATVLLNALISGPISGASMNPARSLAPAMIGDRWEGFWVYIVGPIGGTLVGAWSYNLIRFTNKPLREITKTSSFFKSFTKDNSSS